MHSDLEARYTRQQSAHTCVKHPHPMGTCRPAPRQRFTVAPFPSSVAHAFVRLYATPLRHVFLARMCVICDTHLVR